MATRITPLGFGTGESSPCGGAEGNAAAGHECDRRQVGLAFVPQEGLGRMLAGFNVRGGGAFVVCAGWSCRHFANHYNERHASLSFCAGGCQLRPRCGHPGKSRGRWRAADPAGVAGGCERHVTVQTSNQEVANPFARCERLVCVHRRCVCPHPERCCPGPHGRARGRRRPSNPIAPTASRLSPPGSGTG